MYGLILLLELLITLIGVINIYYDKLQTAIINDNRHLDIVTIVYFEKIYNK